MIQFVYKRKRRVAGQIVIAPYYSGKLQMPWESSPTVIHLHTPDKRIAERELGERARDKYLEHQRLLAPLAVRQSAEKPIAELLELYLQDLRAKGRAENTIDKYSSNIRTLAKACGWEKLRSVTAGSFCEWRAGSKCGPKSLNDTLANMQGFLNWLQRQRMAGESPLAGVDRVDMRLVERYRRALSESEQVKLLATAPHFRAVVYLLILETGARRSEIDQLHVRDFVLDSPAPFVRLPASITKNRREANMRLRPHVVAAVRSVLPELALPSEWVFHNRVPRIETFVRDLKRAGIPFQTEHGRVDLHSLRVTFCMNLLNSGVHPRVVQELMRHSDIKLTMKNYTDPSQLPLAAALEKMPKLALGNTPQTLTPIGIHEAVAEGVLGDVGCPAKSQAEGLAFPLEISI